MKRRRKKPPFPLAFLLLLPLFYFLFPSSSEPSHRSDNDALAPMEVVADGFKELRGVAVDANDLVYVADREAGTVTRIGADQSKTIIAASLDRPTGLAFDLSGRLLIVERGKGRLIRLEADGSLSTVVSGMRAPRWVTVAGDGSVYLSSRGLSSEGDGGWGGGGWGDGDFGEDEPGGAILRLSPSGVLTVFAGGFERLRGVLVHGQTLYAAAERSSADTGHRHGDERDNGAIFQIPILPDGTAGAITRFTQNDLDEPVGIVRDSLGALYVSAEDIKIDWKSREAIGKVALDGTVSRFTSGLDRPRGLALDSHGNLYVAVRDESGFSGWSSGSSDQSRLLRFLAPPSPTVNVPAFTNQNPITVNGTAEVKSRIDAFLNGAATPITVLTEDGNFSLTLNLTPNTQNTLSVFTTAKSGQGLTGAPAEFSNVHDDLAPVIANVSPSDGSFLNDTTPQIKADFSDSGSGVDVSKVVIQLDGLDVTSEAQITASGFAFTPSTPLTEGAHAVSIAISDQAENTATASVALIIDTTPPIITSAIDPAPNANGWNNTDVTVSFTCTDAISGVATCNDPIVVTTEGAGQVVRGTGTDLAGNTATLDVALNIDKTPPALTSATDPPPNANGWNNTDTTVTFSATDSLSGVTSVTPPVTLTTEGAGQVVSGTATDTAGNTNIASVAVSIDKAAPSVAINSPQNWAIVNETPVTVSGTTTETLSGIAEVTCNGDFAILSDPAFTCDVPLIDGANSIVVDATDVAGNAGSSSISVNLVVGGLEITITSPAPGSVVNVSSILVKGVVDAQPGTEVGVTVNGFPAAVQENTFTALIPVTPDTTSLTAVATTAGGITASQTIAISVIPGTGSQGILLASPASGVAPLTVNFSLFGGPTPTQVELDADGDGVADFSGTDLREQPFSYVQAGVYVATATVTDGQGSQFTVSAVVQVYDQVVLDALLQTKWTGMKGALSAGDIPQALAQIVASARDGYTTLFNNLGVRLSEFGDNMPPIQPVYFEGTYSKYRLRRQQQVGGTEMTITYYVYFGIDSDGIWRIQSF